MDLSVEDVRKIAVLARLHLTPEEERTFVPQLDQILHFFDRLSAMEIGEAELEEGSDTLEAADRPRPSLDRDVFLRNAPQTRPPFLLVPQVKATPDG